MRCYGILADGAHVLGSLVKCRVEELYDTLAMFLILVIDSFNFLSAR